MMTDAAQNVVWNAKVEPFGKVLIKTQTIVNNVRLPGQYADVETGLNYNYFRDCYDPSTGRYCEADPIGLRGGLNLFAYVKGNPLRWTDPLGLAIGDFPPPPPGYIPGKWLQGEWPNGRPYLIDPEAKVWTVHPEDDGHWRHWDKQDSDGNDDGSWPPNPDKPWPGQKKKLKPNQCPHDPSGNTPSWEPLDPNFPPGNPKTMLQFVPGLVNPPSFPSLRIPIRIPMFVP